MEARSNRGGVRGGGDAHLLTQDIRQRRSRLTPIDDLLADHRANAGTTGRHHPTQGPETAPESASNRPAEAEHRSDATELLKGPQRARRAKSRRSRATVPDWAAALMAQWSAVDFHDEPHQQSNITQVANLFAASGLSAEAFRARMYQARSLTLRYAGSIRKRAEGSDWQKNRAPYFFRILREQLGMADGQPAAAPQIPRSSPAQGVYPRPPDDSAAYFAGPWGEAIKRLREEQEADGGS